MRRRMAGLAATLSVPDLPPQRLPRERRPETYAVPGAVRFGEVRSGRPAAAGVASRPLLTEAVLPAAEPLGTPLRCRLGFHSWVTLALSLAGARVQRSAAFCRHCPAV